MAKPSRILVAVGLVLAALPCIAGSALDPSQPHYERPAQKGGAYKERVIVFVHGIFGDANGTWRYSSNAYWPSMLLTDNAFQDSDVYVAQYSTPHFGNMMSLDDIVTNLNNRLVNDEVFSKHREVVFVCHSLGGIVVQRLLLTFRPYARQVPFIYFFSTPETGAQIAKLASLFDADPLLKAILPGDENNYLQNMENEWRASHFHIHRLCAYETKKYRGVLVVDRLIGTRDCDEPAIAIAEDHLGIVKPRNREQDSYIALRNAVMANPIAHQPTGGFARLRGKLKDEQDDAYRHLELHVRPSSNAQDAMLTTKNGGATDLGHHAMVCDLPFARFENGTTLEDMLLQRTPESDTLLAGDSESTTCLSVVPVASPMFCADMTVNVEYVLATQPLVQKDKKFRFFGHRDGPEFVWDPEPVNAPRRYCH